MMNEMRTGDVVVGTGDFASAQCLIQMRRPNSNSNNAVMSASSASSSSSSSNGVAALKKNLTSRPDEVVKRTRSINVYELSQDLLDKQIELLERKYGGHARANHAARVIQRAFRHYSMRRKFATITAMAKADQRRFSRRIHSELVESAWAATTSSAAAVSSASGAVTSSAADAAAAAAAAEPDLVEDSGTQAEHVIRTNFAALYRELAETVEGARSAAQRPPPPRQQIRLSPHHFHFHPHFHMHQHHHFHMHHATTSAMSPYGMYQTTQQFDASHYQYHHGTPPPPMPPASGSPAIVNCAGPSPVSHTPYGSHHHHHSYHQQQQQQLQQQQQQHGAAEFRRNDSKSGSKRVPPEVPRRVSSTLSTKSSSVDSPGVRGGSRPHTPSCLPTDGGLERRASNLSAEHSNSEDSLEGAGGYSNTFWCENGSAPQSAGAAPPPAHSSPVPYAHHPAAGHALHERLAASVAAAAAAAAGTPVTASASSTPTSAAQTKLLENMRKRQYRVGLNLFNKKPERGVAYLTQKGFLEASPRAVAKFFITRKGVSKQMIGEYLGNLQNPFNMAALDYFIEELDFAGLEIDEALRRFQTYFRMPGEAQKIERLMEVFGQRYCQCNPQVAARLRNPDTVFILAFAIIMLNTDLHTPSLKADKRMKLEDFIKNLRGIDDGANIDQDMLVGIYERVKATEFKPGADHVTQVLKVQQSIVGKKPNLVLPHRRLVCYCRLYEVADVSRRERPGLHQREVFLFNDILVVTKIFSKKKNGVTYSFRQSFQLAGLNVSYFESHHYPFGIRLSQRVDNRSLIMFNARNDHDRAKFCEDLREAILEMDEMETLRIEGELDKQRSSTRLSRTPNTPPGLGPAQSIGTSTPASSSSSSSSVASSSVASASVVASAAASTAAQAAAPARPDKPDNRDNRDSGVADMDHSGCASASEEASSTPLTRRASQNGRRDAANRPETTLKRTTLSNSLLDIHDPIERYQRRGSVGSLDSGMSISFQSSTTNSTMSRDSSPKNLQAHPPAAAAAAQPQQPVQQLPPSVPANLAGRTRGLQHQSSFLGNIFHKAGVRERKNSRGANPDSAAPSQNNCYPTPHCTDV